MLTDIVIFLGAPGTGKGSLSQLSVKRLGWTQLSTGNLCRQHIADKTDIGQQIDFAIKSGKLISDSLVIDMVEDWLLNKSENNSVVILDGFPRTVAQAQALHQFLKEKCTSVKLTVVQLVLPKEAIIARLANRRICQNNKCQAVYSLLQEKTTTQSICDECASPLICRPDDEPKSICHRLEIHEQHEAPLIDFYNNIGQQVKTCDVGQPLEFVYKEFLTIMDLKST